MTYIPSELIKQNFYASIFPYFVALHLSPSSRCGFVFILRLLFKYYQASWPGPLSFIICNLIFLFLNISFLSKMLLRKLLGQTHQSSVHNVCQEKAASPPLSSPKIFAFSLKYPVDLRTQSNRGCTCFSLGYD